MSASRLRQVAARLGLVTLLLSVPAPSLAQEDVITIRESTLNKFAEAMDPLHFERTAKLNLVINLLVDTVTITLCDGVAEADVDVLSVEILAAFVLIKGTVEASWCGFSAPSTPFMAPAFVRWDAGQRAIVMDLPSVGIRPQVLGISFPVSIPVTPSLRVPPIPVDTSTIAFETARGTRTLRATAHDVSLSQEDGKLELRADVAVW